MRCRPKGHCRAELADEARYPISKRAAAATIIIIIVQAIHAAQKAHIIKSRCTERRVGRPDGRILGGLHQLFAVGAHLVNALIQQGRLALGCTRVGDPLPLVHVLRLLEGACNGGGPLATSRQLRARLAEGVGEGGNGVVVCLSAAGRHDRLPRSWDRRHDGWGIHRGEE